MSYQSNIVLVLAKSLSNPASLIPIHNQNRKELMAAYSDFFNDTQNENASTLAKMREDPDIDLSNYSPFVLDSASKEYVERRKAEICNFHTIEHYSDTAPASHEKHLGETSRLLVVAHGAPNSAKYILQDNGTDAKGNPIDQHLIDAEKLLSWTKAILGKSKVNRISLHVCYAGGGYPNVMGNPKVFAHNFALKAADVCTTVSARSGIVGTQQKGQRLIESMNKVIRGDRYVNGVYQADNSKYIYKAGADAKPVAFDYSEKKLIAEQLEKQVSGLSADAKRLFDIEMGT